MTTSSASPYEIIESPAVEIQNREATTRTLAHVKPTESEFALAQAEIEEQEASSAVREVSQALVDAGDSETIEHSSRVARVAVVIAHRIGMSGPERSVLAQAGLLHDVGKADPLMQKYIASPRRYTDAERVKFRGIIRLHPFLSAHEINQATELTEDQKTPLIYLALAHHAYKRDGPYGALPPQDQATAAQVLTLADTIDALASTRSYKAAHQAADGPIIQRVQRDLVVEEGLLYAAFKHRHNSRFRRGLHNQQ